MNFRQKDRINYNDDQAVVCDCKSQSLDCSTNVCCNREAQIECTDDNCNNKSCCNRRFQNLSLDCETENIDVRMQGNQGAGIVGLKEFKAGELIAEYKGKLISYEEARMTAAASTSTNYVVMRVSNNIYVDPLRSKSRCRASYINNSCDPNCVVEVWVVNSVTKIGIFAKRHINRLEWLSFQYKFCASDMTQCSCYCNATNCCGTFASSTFRSQPLYEIEKILSTKIIGGKSLYLIKWKGYPSSQNTWEPENGISPQLLDRFYDRRPSTSTVSSVSNKISQNETIGSDDTNNFVCPACPTRIYFKRDPSLPAGVSFQSKTGMYRVFLQGGYVGAKRDRAAALKLWRTSAQKSKKVVVPATKKPITRSRTLPKYMTFTNNTFKIKVGGVYRGSSKDEAVARTLLNKILNDMK